MCLAAFLAACSWNFGSVEAQTPRQMPPRVTAKRVATPSPASPYRSPVQVAQRPAPTLADIAAREAELEKKLEELEKREAALIERTQRLSAPVVVPSPQRAFRNTSDRDLRIPQSYYYNGEGHFID